MLTNSLNLFDLRSFRNWATKRVGCRVRPMMVPLTLTTKVFGPYISVPVANRISKQYDVTGTSYPYSNLPSTPSMNAKWIIGSSSTSVVMWVISARFFTSPHASPSGVSLGQSTPHWLGCNALGPLTFLVFSNWEEMRVIIPRAEMKLKRLRTWVTPARSILNRLSDQLPVEIARTNPAVRWSPWNCIVLYASNSVVRDGFLRTLSIALFKLELYVLNRSSKSNANNCPALIEN